MGAMNPYAFLSKSVVCVSLLLAACGGGQKPESADDAKADEASSGADKPADKADADGAKADAAKADGKDAAKPAPADDGPKPTFQRWCNNGLALRFIPA